MAGPQVEVFIGPFGSGKTEVALNRALSLAATGAATTLIDLDLVDPFFRARGARQTLEAAGVRVVAPERTWDNVDLPLFTPEVFAALIGPGHVLVDAGGEAYGAVPLRQVGHLLPGDAAIYLVVNPCRPFMGSPDEIAQACALIGEAAGRPVTALVASPHLGAATTADVVREGLRVVEAAASRLGLPTKWTAVSAALLPELVLDGAVLPLRLLMVPPWEGASSVPAPLPRPVGGQDA